MTTHRRNPGHCLLTAVFLFLAAVSVPAAEPALTFFGWSDQHVQTDGDGEHLVPAIDAMNALPGTEYPESIGGQVERPAFVFGCGDITEWPTIAAMNTFDRLIRERLRFPSVNVLGNHDQGGREPSETMANWLRKRRGALSYTFDCGGVRFILVDSKYDESLNSPAQPITDEALKFVRESLEDLSPGQPVIVATHLCYDAMTNRDQLVDALGEANVLMVLGGHYHKAKVDTLRGTPFVQLPSPAPGTPSEFTVVRITTDRLTAVPYDYAEKKWVTEPRKMLDVKIEGPSAEALRDAAAPEVLEAAVAE
jgi:hypothetical protein